MSSNPIRVPVPERQPESVPASSRPAWTREKKNTRFVIKIGGIIPS
jgi:hypothetical protein